MRILPFLLAAATAWAADCANCTSDKLCQPHADGDKEAVKRFREGMVKPDAGVRKAALEGFAAACAEHANCRPAANAQLVGALLKDPDLGVKSRAAEILGESQDAKTAVKLLDPLVAPIEKRLVKEPKGDREIAEWDNDLAFLESIIKALAATKSPDAGPAMARLLESKRIVVIEITAGHAASVRSPAVPPAIITAVENLRKTPSNPERDKAWMALVKGWEELTKSGIAPPEIGSSPDAIRFVADCRKWWKENEKKWK